MVTLLSHFFFSYYGVSGNLLCGICWGGRIGVRFIFLRPRLQKQILKDRTVSDQTEMLQGLLFLKPQHGPATISLLLLEAACKQPLC